MADLTLLNHLLTEDATFIDVGANQGVFSLFVAKRLVKGQVLAFEPEHQNLQLLAQNIKLNALTNITVIDKGLADTAKTVKIYGPLCEARDRTFNRGMASTISCGNIANHLGNIEVIALDHYVSEQNIKRVDVIKIDIEGGELSALRGMNSVLRRFGPALHIELNTPSCQAAGYLPRDILNFLQHHGYRFFEIVSTRNLLPFQNPQYFFKPFVHIHPTRNAQNIFCIKRDEHRIAISHLLKK
jgi:FkbM family methyltransferase